MRAGHLYTSPRSPIREDVWAEGKEGKFIKVSGSFFVKLPLLNFYGKEISFISVCI